MDIIHKLINEINGVNRKDVVDEYESTIAHDVTKVINDENFFSLPLNIILGIVSKTNFVDQSDPISLIKKLVQKTIDSHQNENETILLLNSLKTNSIDINLKSCIDILSLFKQCDIFVQLQKHFEDNQDIQDIQEPSDLGIENIEEKPNSVSDFEQIAYKPEYFEPDIFIATEEGKLSNIQYLIEHEGIDVNKQASNDYNDKTISKGDTILHIASMKGSLPIVQYLIDKGANFECNDSIKRTPLHIACQNGHLEIVQYLIEKCVNIEAKDNEQKTPLHIACENNQLQVVEYFIEKGAYIEARDKQHQTPLLIACEKSYLPIIQYLIEKGAHIEAGN